MSRLGLFGGTFDPIHVGHLDVALAALHALELERVLVVPANVPPHRATPRAPAAHRFAMAGLAVADLGQLALLDIEMRSEEPSYTSTTLDRLQQSGVDARGLCVITGADAFRDIQTWKHYPALLDRCPFVVVSRPDTPVSSLRSALPALAERMVDVHLWNRAPEPSRIVLIHAPTAPVSSTDIRRRVAAGESISGLVPPAVERYIAQHGLYRA